MNSRRIFFYLAFSLLVAGSAYAVSEAQQQDKPAVEKSKEDANDSESVRSDPSGNNDSEKKDKRFVPRERISADGAISFPADI